MRFVNILTAAATAVCMTVVSLFPAAAMPAATPDSLLTVSAAVNGRALTEIRGQGAPGSNLSANNYEMHGKIINSYLHEISPDMLERIEVVDGKVVVEQVSAKDGALMDTHEIAFPLPLFGGCFTGVQYNFLVFGQENDEQSPAKEVIRVMQYDKNWKFLNEASLTGINTTNPFRAGSLRMEETNGKLFIHTCHNMFFQQGGIHQGNMSFVFNEQTLKLEQSMHEILYDEAGFYSHSFNQFIRIDGETVYRLDHGDCLHRSVLLNKAPVNNIKSCKFSQIYPIAGDYDVHGNATGVSLGGLELSDRNCIIVGNSVDMNAVPFNPNMQRNIFVCVTDKNLTTTNVKWYTDYEYSSEIMPLTPQLVKLNSNLFLMMWEEMDKGTRQTKTKAMLLDGEGNAASEIKTIPAGLSDCQPFVAADGRVCWYTANRTAPTYYMLDVETLMNGVQQEVSLGDVDEDSNINASDATVILIIAVRIGTTGESGVSPEAETAADVNSDSTIDAEDATIVLRYAAAVGTGSDEDITAFIN